MNDYVLLWLFALGVNAVFCGTVASLKGFWGVSWGVGGFFFGPIALLAVVGLPDVKQRKYLRLLLEHKGISPESGRDEIAYVEPSSTDQSAPLSSDW